MGGMGCTCAHGTKLRASDTNLCIKSREWNQETALQLKSAHSSCVLILQRVRLHINGVSWMLFKSEILMHAGSLQLLLLLMLLLRRTFEAC